MSRQRGETDPYRFGPAPRADFHLMWISSPTSAVQRMMTPRPGIARAETLCERG